ncbi:aryl-sulfate sulfotransferase [Myxococcota bacterium]|nr:aryl-sulfate sulfotransferase [Myxococcota bacterium]
MSESRTPPLRKPRPQPPRRRPKATARAGSTAALLAALFAAGCGKPPGAEDPDDDTTPPDDDTAPGDDDAAPGVSVSATVSPVIPTVVTAEVSVDGGSAQQAWIEIGPDEGYGRTVPLDVSGPAPWSTWILGLKPSRTWHLRAVAVVEGEERASADQVVETGSPPGTLAGLGLSGSDPAAAHEGFIVTSFMGEPSTAVILDRDAEPVWWYGPGGTELISRAVPSRDGRSILFIRGVLEVPDQAIVRVSFDGADVEATPTPGAHHDFVELPGGTYAALVTDPREVEGKTVDGDRIVEFGPGGEQTAIWSVWDTFEFSEASDHLAGTTWSHANALDYDEDEDAYSVSLLGLDAIVRVDRATGESFRIVGGRLSDFATPGGETRLFENQHQFEIDGDVLRVFDNGTPSSLDSRAREYLLDDSTGTADLVWSYGATPPLYCYNLGDVFRMEDGHTLVNFGVLGQLDEVDEDGEVLWRINLDLGAAFGYTTYLESLP